MSGESVPSRRVDVPDWSGLRVASLGLAIVGLLWWAVIVWVFRIDPDGVLGSWGWGWQPVLLSLRILPGLAALGFAIDAALRIRRARGVTSRAVGALPLAVAGALVWFAALPSPAYSPVDAARRARRLMERGRPYALVSLGQQRQVEAIRQCRELLDVRDPAVVFAAAGVLRLAGEHDPAIRSSMVRAEAEVRFRLAGRELPEPIRWRWAVTLKWVCRALERALQKEDSSDGDDPEPFLEEEFGSGWWWEEYGPRLFPPR